MICLLLLCQLFKKTQSVWEQTALEVAVTAFEAEKLTEQELAAVPKVSVLSAAFSDGQKTFNLEKDSLPK